MTRRLRILTWHVHGNYMYYLSQVPHEFYLVADEARSPHHTGRSGALPWGPNVHEAPVSHLADMPFDVVLMQSRDAYEHDIHAFLSPAQQRLPRIYLEHDPPQQHPTDTPHWVQDRNTLLVHVTPFNALMWDNGITPHRVIEHGVTPIGAARYSGTQAAGVVVVNNMDRRGRRLGADIFEDVREQIPLSLVGMGAERMGGIGEVAHDQLAAFMAAHRFFFHPARYTSLGLAVIEAMMAGLPIVGLATTELSTVIRSGDNGWIDTRLPPLIEGMRTLLASPDEARSMGERARQTALERFNIERFVQDWQDALQLVSS